jgi:hypothetical protein
MPPASDAVVPTPACIKADDDDDDDDDDEDEDEAADGAVAALAVSATPYEAKVGPAALVCTCKP